MDTPYVKNDLPSLPGIAHAATAVNESRDRYRAMCLAVVSLLAKVKLPREDLQDMLSDVSDILDGLPPSPRSGFRPKR